MNMETKENYKWIALSCTTLGALLSVLSSNTVLIALPVIARDLHASLETVIWTLMIYMLAITILVPAIGRGADIIGRKKLYVAGFAIFTAAALLCGLAQNGWELVAARLVQAVGGSLMMACSTVIVADAFPTWQLGTALGINGMMISAGSIIGPILGGFLTSWGWRWVFFFNIPLGVIGTFWAWKQLREVVKLPEGQIFDWKGTFLLTTSLGLILWALTFGEMIGWGSPLIIAGLVVGCIALIIFLDVEKKLDQPLLDLSLFTKRILAAAYASNLLSGIARGAVTFLMVFFFQVIWGIDPLQAGIMLAPFAVAMMIVAPLSGYLSDRYGSRGLSSAGLFISAISLYGLAQIQYATPKWQVMFWMVIMGAGSGLFFSPNTSAIMSAVTPERRGIAAGTRTMMNNAGMLISMALGLALTTSSMTPQAMQGLFAGTQVGSEGVSVNLFILGLHRAFWVSCVICIFAALVSLLRGPHDSSGTGTSSASPDDCRDDT